MMKPLAPEHRAPLIELIRATPEFSREEADVAIELLDACLEGDRDYVIWVDADEGVRGYICYGPTPMTEGTYDLYWIAVAPSFQGHGVGRALIAHMESELTREGARLVRVETEGGPAYESTRAFYEAIGYECTATIRAFYAAGRDLVIYTRYLTP
ncbi:GNAT family N-acetyltransferase [Pendulispora brunnea]|uniref:GNAT family N-acetyltransferase n=1 Tax=Pendulispora brunnea TaxID=2905690 RepID=A0ABZ2K2V8_9BACT